LSTFLKVVLIVVGIIIVIIAAFVIFLSSGLNSGKNLVINDIDLSKISDGIYKGEYSGGRWSNTLEVTVKDHKIIGIKIIKDVTFAGNDTSGKIFDSVVGKQSLNVDAVSGATVTSKAYLKAVENALSQKQ
jgi:uncharacterized protein with FMN-binding domain